MVLRTSCRYASIQSPFSSCLLFFHILLALEGQKLKGRTMKRLQYARPFGHDSSCPQLIYIQIIDSPITTSLQPHALLHRPAPASFVLRFLPRAANHSYHMPASQHTLSHGATVPHSFLDLLPPSPDLSSASALSMPRKPDSARAIYQAELQPRLRP